MNKTVSIHLQGMNFIFEEQAYELLKDYLTRLKEVLKNEQGRDDILQDVELRIVELLQAGLTPFKQVIELKTVEEIISKLGQPEAFSSEEQETFQSSNTEAAPSEKRLFRDGDHAMLGGVCAGVAAYFNVDVVIIRALYIFAFLTLGLGFLLYIILWAIIPLAKTSSEKLQMKGQAVNVENMKSELEDAANRLKKGAKEFKRNAKISSNIGQVLRVISVIIGIWALLFGTGVFVLAILFFFVNPDIIPAQMNGHFMSFQDFGGLLFESSSHKSYFYGGIALICIALVAQSYLFGIRLITRIKASYMKVLSVIFGVTGVIGIVFVSLGGIQIGRSMAIYGEVQKELGTVSGSSLVLQINPVRNAEVNGFKVTSNGDEGFITIKNGHVFLHGIELVYTQSSDSLFHIRQINDAQGRSHEQALKNARNVNCAYQINGNQFQIESMYSFPVKDKFRDQNVKFMISVPRGSSIIYEKNEIYPQWLKDDVETNETYQHGYISGNGHYSKW